jgi:hypothetical protein
VNFQFQVLAAFPPPLEYASSIGNWIGARSCLDFWRRKTVSIFPLPVIEPRFLSCLASSPFTIPNVLSNCWVISCKVWLILRDKFYALK